MKKLLVLHAIFLITFFAQAQKNVFLDVAPMYQNTNLEMNVNYTAWNGKTFKLDHFDYYLTNVELTYDGGQTILIDSVFLVEPQNHTLLLGNFNISQIETIKFIVGVPKPLNTQAGSQAIDISLYPENHPLSFQSPSMYWGWAAGYMHMIIGGFADDNGDGNLEAYFELHNLGNQNQKLVEFPTIIQTNTSSNQIDIFMNCQVDRWINNIPLSTVGVLHGETGNNATILNNVLTQDVFIQPANASIESLNTNSKIYFQNHGEGITVFWTEIKDLNQIRVFDLNGRSIKQIKTNMKNGSFQLDHLQNGYYLIQFYNENNRLIGSLNAVH
ncbi:MAG: T9SS type A sorting domain-containing protein [Bacteroidetes bacterium]|nr:T9SS type A sorting domain-containing protein [Bacteroidota bacterium]